MKKNMIFMSEKVKKLEDFNMLLGLDLTRKIFRNQKIGLSAPLGDFQIKVEN
jgi:hypothetical protein